MGTTEMEGILTVLKMLILVLVGGTIGYFLGEWLGWAGVILAIPTGFVIGHYGDRAMSWAGTALLVILLALSSCNDADVVSQRISQDADTFQIARRITLYNARNDVIMATAEGLCSLGNHDSMGELTITCKTGPADYKKLFWHTTRDVTYFVDQTVPSKQDPYHFKVVIRPSTLIPDIEVR